MVKSRLLGKILVFLMVVSSVLSPVTAFSIGSNELKEYVGPGKHETELFLRNQQNEEELIYAGKVSMWNTKDEFILRIDTIEDWLMSDVRIFVGNSEIPVSKSGTPQIGQFPYREKLNSPVNSYELTLNLRDDLNFTWSNKKQGQHVQNVCVCVKLADSETICKDELHCEAWAFGGNEFENRGGWWTKYALSKPHTGHFIDSPVGGAGYSTGSQKGKTNSSGAFYYIDGETVSLNIGKLHLGSAFAKHKVTILDLAGTDLINDIQVINRARLLQSLDEDGDPKRGIFISEPIINCLERSMDNLSISELDFSDTEMVESLLKNTVDNCSEININLSIVSPEEALENLEKGLESVVFRKNVSKTPDMDTAKVKLELMPVYVPAQKANGDQVQLIYKDSEGIVESTRYDAKPLVAVYADEIPDTDGAMDVFGAISRDEGNTWKVTNLSRSADKSSFKLKNGYDYPGDVLKPNIKIQGNKIMVIWTSRYARSGQPRYSLPKGHDYYEEDIWGVSGPQRSTDYAELDFPEVGELPYHCVWTCRGTIDELTGEITWFKPERLTSGRRDAYQVAVNGANNAGFAVVWQEDPEGVRPGEMAGPGSGWSGATTNHKTDIWYSYIKWDDFDLIDENFVSGGDPQHDDDKEVSGRPKSLVPFSLPVRISDNDTLNSDNMKLLVDENGPVKDEEGRLVVTTSSAITTGSAITKKDSDSGNSDKDHENDDTLGSHSYGIEKQDELCADFYEKINNQGVTKWVAITADGRLLDGDTGASRPNIMMQPYQKPDKTYDAYVMICYEETKGVGSGPPVDEEEISTSSSDDSTGNDGSGDKKGADRYYPDKGKNVIYHSFTLTNPDKVKAGTIINPQATDEDGNLLHLTDEEGNPLYDWDGQLIPAYENARRPRLIVQSKKNALGKDAEDGIDSKKEATVMVTVFKMGEEGKGRTSDIFMRRWVVVDDKNHFSSKGNPYEPKNLADECQNISSVTPTKYWINPDSQSQQKDAAVKVVEWVQTEDNLADKSWTNDFDDARAHRGFIKGDFLAIAYDYTPNWAAARNGNDVYNLYIRRSFNGGANWTTDPEGAGVTHENTFKIYPEEETFTELPLSYEELDLLLNDDSIAIESSDDSKEVKERETVTKYYDSGDFEPSRNVSQIANNKETVIEPRLVGVPGTILTDGVAKYPEDTQNTEAFWVTYGTHSNPGRNDEEEGVPLDLYYSYSEDFGENFYTVTKTIKEDSEGNNAGEVVVRWDWLAKDNGQKVSEQAECQIRMTPDGSVFYAVWNESGEDGSDAMFRRIMRNGGSIESVVTSSAITGPEIIISGVRQGAIYNTDVTFEISINTEGTWTATLTKDDNILEVVNLNSDKNPYTIDADENDENEHNYVLKVVAEDTEGNTNTKEISFTVYKSAPVVIDTEAPEITVSGIEDNATYKKTVTPVISVTDDISSEENIYIEAKLNGVTFESGTAISKNGTYTLTVTAWDEANNESTKTYNFIIKKESSGSGGKSDSASSQNSEIAVDISNNKITEAMSEDSKLKVTIPASSTNGNAKLTLVNADENLDLTNCIKVGDLIYSIEVKDKDGVNINQFNNDLILEFYYEDEDLPVGVKEEDLKICYWEETEKIWIVIPSTINTQENVITATTNHLTIYGVMAMPDFPKLDDVKGHWAEKEAYRLISLNIASGDANGKLRPEDKITREEFAKLIVLAADLKPVDNPILTFKDSESIASWAKGYVAAAVDAGFMQGYENNSFKPKQYISRVEIATVIVKALNIQISEYEELNFNDANDIPQWGVPFVAKAVEKGIVTGFSDGTFKSTNNATRAQALVMIYRMLNAK